MKKVNGVQLKPGVENGESEAEAKEGGHLHGEAGLAVVRERHRLTNKSVRVK